MTEELQPSAAEERKPDPGLALANQIADIINAEERLADDTISALTFCLGSVLAPFVHEADKRHAAMVEVFRRITGAIDINHRDEARRKSAN